MTITKNNFILIAVLAIFIAISSFGNSVAAQESDRLYPSSDAFSEGRVMEIDSSATSYAIVDKHQISFYNKNDELLAYLTERESYGRDRQHDSHQSGDTDSSTSMLWQQVQDTNSAGDNFSTAKAPQSNTVFEAVTLDDDISFDWHMPTDNELFALMDFSSSISSSYEGSDTSGLNLLEDTAYFDFTDGEEGSGEDFFKDRNTPRSMYLASIAFDYHPVRIGDDAVADYSAGTLGLQIESIDDLNRDDILDREEEKNAEEKSGDWDLDNATEPQDILNFIRTNSAIGPSEIDAMFNTTPILINAVQDNYPESDFEYDLPFRDLNYFSLVIGEETTQQAYELNCFYGDVAIDDEMDLGSVVNIFTIDTQGSITGLARKIQGMLL